MSTTTFVPDVLTLSLGLLIARLVFGLLLAGHGAQKMFGWFGGYGIAGTAGYFENLGFRPGRPFVIAAALFGEIVGGLLLAAGLLGPIGPAVALSTMIVAAATVHWKNGVFAASNGIELPLLYAALAGAIGLTGPGLFSLDSVLRIEHLWTPGLKVLILALGVVAGATSLLARRPATVTATA